MLGAFVVLCVALVVAAILGAGKTGHSSSKSSQYDRSNPVPLRHAAVIGGGWRFKVLAVRRNANRQVLAVRNYGYAVNHAPPRGAQDFMVLLAMTYAGGGKDDAHMLLDFGLHAMGAHNAAYDLIDDSCGAMLPKPNLQRVSNLYSRQTVRGWVCFQIAKNDARTLMLFSGNYRDPSGLNLIQFTNIKRVWFALRRG